MTYRPDEGFRRRAYTRLMDWYHTSSIRIPLFNSAARTALKVKYGLDRKRVSRYCAGREAEIDEWFSRTRLFFGFSSGRAGTVFLADLLKREVDDSHIEHEANVDDYWNLPAALRDEKAALAYVRDFRRGEIFFRVQRNVGIYGEVNPFLRFHCKAIVESFPGARCFHLVRDPRHVVRSMVDKGAFSNKDPFNNLIRPPASDPYRSSWPEMTAFEKYCWLWQYENRLMRRSLPHRVHFEPLVRDYHYFRRMLLDYLGLEIPMTTWEKYVSRPRNVSRVRRLGHWSEWDKRLFERFEQICGAEMVQYGYRI